VPPTPAPRSDRRLTRRTALGAVGLASVGVAAAACDGPTATPSGRATVRSTEITPDVALAVGLVAGMQRSVALTTDVVRQFPLLRPALRPLLETQRAHLALLRDAVPTSAMPSPSAVSVPGTADRAAARARVVRSTEARREAVNAAALEAESGPFARVLASMGAGLSQRLAVLEGSA
jgi:hypothetical protein